MPSQKAREAICLVKMKVLRPARLNGEYLLRWISPTTGRAAEERTGLRVARKAWQAAADKAMGLVGGEVDTKVEWTDFCWRYETEHISHKADATAKGWSDTKAAICRYRKPRYLHEITDRYISAWQAILRRPRPESGFKPLAEASIAAYSGRLRSALNWAKRRKMLSVVPHIDMPDVPARGRPVTQEEFERLLAAVLVVRKTDPDRWRLLLRGIFWSGLRRNEVIDLSWEPDAKVWLDASGEFPLIWFSTGGQKGRRADVQPVPEEFWHVCLEASGDRRTGYVFDLQSLKADRRLCKFTVSHIISKIGRTAGVVVDPDTGKHATAHDLRRSFASNMDDRLTVAELQKAMRHKDIRTTIKYYNRKQAIEIARKMRKGGVLGGVAAAPAASDRPDGDATP